MTATPAKRAAVPVSLIRATAEVTSFPGLDRVGDRMAKGLAAAIQGLAGSTDVTRGAVDIVRHGDWQAFDTPVAAIRYRLGAANGWALAVIEKPLLSRLVDCFYGGAGSSKAGDAFTPAEERFLARLARTLQPAFGAAWADHAGGEPVLDRCEVAMPALSGSAAAAEIAVQPFALAGAVTGAATIAVAYPLAMLRAMPSLAAPAGTGDALSASPAWRRRLSDAVMQARLPVRTIFAQPEIPLADLLGLQPGDIIPICLPGRLPVTVAGRLFARASLGEQDGRASVMIETIEQKDLGHE